MSDVSARLGVDAVDLLFSIAETPEAALSGRALYDFHANAGRTLTDTGAIKPDGFEPVAASGADHDDALVSLFWSAERGGYAYFSPAGGLIRVDDNAIVRFRLDKSWLLGWVAGQLGQKTGGRPVTLVADYLWDLGDLWLGERKRSRRKTAIFLARRLSDTNVLHRAEDALHQHSGRPGGVVLTTTPSPRLIQPTIGAGCTVMPIIACARAGTADFKIDPAIVYAAAHGAKPARATSQIQVAAEFRVVRVGRREFHFGGDKQRQVVGFLHRKWEEGAGRTSKALMFAEVEFQQSTRLRDLFKGHPEWSDLIGQEGGACWLRYDELLAAQGITSD